VAIIITPSSAIAVQDRVVSEHPKLTIFNKREIKLLAQKVYSMDYYHMHCQHHICF